MGTCFWAPLNFFHKGLLQGLCRQASKPNRTSAVESQSDDAWGPRFSVGMGHEFTSQIPPEMSPISDGPNRKPTPLVFSGIVHDGILSTGRAPLPHFPIAKSKKIVVFGILYVVQQCGSPLKVLQIHPGGDLYGPEGVG